MQPGQALAFHVLHDQIVQVAVGAAVEDGHDVGMVKGGGGAGLPAEPGHQLKVIGRAP
jgi:hypothetical protein